MNHHTITPRSGFLKTSTKTPYVRSKIERTPIPCVERGVIARRNRALRRSRARVTTANARALKMKRPSSTSTPSVSATDVAVVVHNYLERRGFARALSAFASDAASVLRAFKRNGGVPRQTKDLEEILREYVEMKERESALRRAPMVVREMNAVVERALARERERANEHGVDASGDETTTERDVREGGLMDEANALADKGQGRRMKGTPRRFVGGGGPPAREPAALGTIVARSPQGAVVMGSLRPFTLPEQIQNEAVQQKMADVIVNALGGRGKLKTATYAAATGSDNHASFLDESAVDDVMNSLLEEDGELRDFLFAMMSEIETQREGVATEANVIRAFASPAKKTQSPRNRE